MAQEPQPVPTIAGWEDDTEYDTESTAPTYSPIAPYDMSPTHPPMVYKPHSAPTVHANVWAARSGIRTVNNSEIEVRPAEEVASQAMDNDLLLFQARAHSQSVVVMVDNGCDNRAILNLDKMEVSKLHLRQSYKLAVHGATGVSTTLAYRIPRFRLSINGVTRVIHNAIAANLPSFDPAIVIGKPYLAQEDVHIDHKHNVVTFPDGSQWRNPLPPGESLPAATWKPTTKPTNVPNVETTPEDVPTQPDSDPHITMKAALKKQRHGTGELYTIRVNLSKLNDVPTTPHDPHTEVDDCPVMHHTATLYQMHSKLHTPCSNDASLSPAQERDLARLKSEFATIGGDLPHRNRHSRFVGNHPIDLYPNAEKRIPYRPPNKMAPDQMTELRKQLKYLLEHGFLRPSKSPIATLVFFVPKPAKVTTDDKGNTTTTKRWRMVVDYRGLNNETVKDRFPCPDLSNAVDRLSGHKYYSAIDLTAGFWQLPIRPGDEYKTAITTPLGLFEWTVMPFGLCNAPASFNRITQKLFGHSSKHHAYCEPFVDDIGIFSDSWKDHLKHVRDILATLRDNGLYANLEKCHLGKRSLKFLGEIVSHEGRSPDPERISAIVNWPTPRSHQDVRVFLGMTGYLSPYIPTYSARVKPLNKVRNGQPGSGGHQPSFRSLWGPDQQSAFEQLKITVSKAPVLIPPDYTSIFYIQHDASETALGAVLLQKSADSAILRPVAFGSRSLVGAEPSWPTHDLELEALRFGLERFKHYFGLNRVVTIGDHKPLLHIRTQTKLSTRQLRVMEAISGFNFMQLYWAGPRLKIADMLSRSPQPHVDTKELTARLTAGSCEICAAEVWKDICSKHQSDQSAQVAHNATLLSLRCKLSKAVGTVDALSAENIVASYQYDARTKRIKEQLESKHANHFKRRYRKDSDGRIFERSFELSDPFTHGERLVLPVVQEDTSIITAAIRVCHEVTTSGHSGTGATFHRVRARFTFRGMWDKVTAFVLTCHRCQYARHSTKAPFGLSKPLEPPVPIPGADLSTDFTFGLPPATHPVTGLTYEGIQVWMDRLTRRIRLLPVNKTITAKQCASLYRMEVASQWGQMRSLVSDRDPRFTGEFWIELAKSLGTVLKMSSPRHPTTDGQSEQAMSWIAVMIRSFCGSSPDSWVSFLPDLEFCINSSPSRSRDGLSPFVIWQGFKPLEAIDLVAPTLAARSSDSDAMDHVQMQRIAVQRARDALKFAQDEVAYRTDKHRTPVRYAPGDFISIHVKHLLPPGEHHRLKKTQDLYSGPFEVISMIGDAAVEINLPKTYRQHNVFHVSGTRLWHSNPNQRDPMSRPEFTMDEEGSDDQSTFTVGAILKWRARRGKSEWLVEWKGYNRAYNSWEPLEAFCTGGTVTTALKMFERTRTGSNESLNAELHKGSVNTEYSPGSPGTQRHAADGFDITYALPRESMTAMSKRLRVPVQDMQDMNKRMFRGLRKSSQFDEGTAVRYRTATLSTMAIRPIYLVATCVDRYGDPYLGEISSQHRQAVTEYHRSTGSSYVTRRTRWNKRTYQ